MNNISQRIRQVAWAVSAAISNNKINIEIINKELNDAERRLFYAMSNVDQYHSYRVYLTVEALIKADKEAKLIKKAALLHDIGRQNGDFPILHKIFSVIVDRFLNFKPAIEKREIIERIIINKRPYFLYIYYYHPQLSKLLLEGIGSDNDLIYLVEQHHGNFNNYYKKDKKQNNYNERLLQLLQKADALN